MYGNGVVCVTRTVTAEYNSALAQMPCLSLALRLALTICLLFVGVFTCVGLYAPARIMIYHSCPLPSAIALQCLVRGGLARKLFSKKREELQRQRSALEIQRVYRGYRGRKRGQCYKEQDKR